MSYGHQPDIGIKSSSKIAAVIVAGIVIVAVAAAYFTGNFPSFIHLQ